jgi:hypothetical protein
VLSCSPAIVSEISLGPRLSSQAKLLDITVLILRMYSSQSLLLKPVDSLSYSMLVGYVVKLLCIVALYIYMLLENKRRDRKAIDGQEVETEGVENGMLVSYILDNPLRRANIYFQG